MTTGTVHGSVGAGQREFCGSMIKAREIAPGLGRVARFATQRPAVAVGACHASCELAFMRISMAGRAVQNFVMIESATAALCRLMTVDASDGDMTAGKHEAGLLMARQVESRRVKGGLVVALFTTIEVRCAGELIAVYVLVAGDAT